MVYRMAKIFLASIMETMDIELYLSMGGRHILLSYAMMKPKFKTGEVKLKEFCTSSDGSATAEILLDSGAFSAYTQGLKLNIDEYAKFVDMHKPDLYINLDVIGDDVATMKNQEYLEKIGLHPMPVYHARDPEWMIDEYVKKYKLIGLGGRSTKTNKEFVHFLRSIIARYPNNDFHCLGCNDRNFLLFNNYYSADATTWNIGSIKGEIPDLSELAGRVYVGSKGIDKVRRDHLYNYGRNDLIKAFYYMELAGIDSTAIYSDDDLEKKKAWFQVLISIEKLHEKHPELFTQKEQSSLFSFGMDDIPTETEEDVSE